MSSSERMGETLRAPQGSQEAERSGHSSSTPAEKPAASRDEGIHHSLHQRRHRCSSEQSGQGPVPLKKPTQTVYRKMAICKTTNHTAGVSLLLSSLPDLPLSPPPTHTHQNAVRRERALAGYIKVLTISCPPCGERLQTSRVSSPVTGLD